jgi:methionyl-tRNA synthetase
VTTALPYANGPLHLGHMVEYIQADIWVRLQKMLGNDCLFICGEDTHGTPIMISAQKQGITPEELIAKIQIEHEADFKDFYIEFDNYYTTHSPENKQLSELIYEKLKKCGDIITRTIAQAYDEKAQIFLPDRYVKGECPHCGAKDQYGDNCEICGMTYSPMDLQNPISTISGIKPIVKESIHYFFRLQNYEQQLRDWLAANRLQEEIVHKLNEWFTAGLHDWDISRDAPYFGFEIPDAPGKYFYVWLDAPIGYMASLLNLAHKKPEISFTEYWDKNSTTELYHFVGKDIVYFHALFWPAMLMSANYRTPTSVFAHGYLTVNNQKMSKSRGTFITARDYLQHLDPEYLRYYFAAKLNSHVEDIDLNFNDFMQRINADLVGKVVNIASRCASFINKNFSGKLANRLDDPKMFEDFVTVGDCIANHYETREYQRAIREIMALADIANHYIDDKKPWTLAKQPGKEIEVQLVCTMGLNLFYVLMIYLKPILPKMAKKAEEFLNIPATHWQTRKQPLLNHTIKPFAPLMQRIMPETINNLS